MYCIPPICIVMHVYIHCTGADEGMLYIAKTQGQNRTKNNCDNEGNTVYTTAHIDQVWSQNVFCKYVFCKNVKEGIVEGEEDQLAN